MDDDQIYGPVQTLIGHLGTIQALRSVSNSPYMLLSVALSKMISSQGSTDNTLRLWDIKKKSLSKVISLFDGFTILNNIVLDETTRQP